jgi:hypothetical protein
MRFDLPQVRELLLEMGLRPEDFSAVGQARNREEAIQLVSSLKAKFKAGFKRMIHQTHPDRNGGDPTKFNLLMQVAKEFESLKVKDPKPTVRYHTVFNAPIPPRPPKRGGIPHYYPVGYHGTTTVNPHSTNAAEVVNLKPRGVSSPRGR